MTRRLLVTGARDLPGRDEARVAAALVDALRATFDPAGGPVTLVHGDAPGVDRFAAALWQRWGWPVEAHPADWKGRGKAAGPERNQRMVDAGADVCAACPGPDSVGTWDCVGRARDAGIPVHAYPLSHPDDDIRDREEARR